MEQRHVLCSMEWQAPGAVMVYHLWDAGEHTAALVQGEAVLFGLGHDDVNTTLTRPETKTRNKKNYIYSPFDPSFHPLISTVTTLETLRK